MIDALIAAWLILFLCSPLWVMFLYPFFAKNPRRLIFLVPFFGLGAGFLIGLFGDVLASKSGGPVGQFVELGTIFGALAGLAMMASGLLGMMVRHLILERQFTIKTGMVAVAAVGVLCGLIRLFIT
jgi:hypothetical protein